MQKLHSWTLDSEEAVALQASLRERVVLTWADPLVRAVGGGVTPTGLARRVSYSVTPIYPHSTQPLPRFLWRSPTFRGCWLFAKARPSWQPGKS